MVNPKKINNRADRSLQQLGIVFLLGLSSACRISLPVAASDEARASPSAASCPPGDHRYGIDSGGATRYYTLHVPPVAAAETSASVVIGFHGFGGKADLFGSYSGFSALADREGFLAVYPQGAGEVPNWEVNPVDPNADVDFVRKLLDDVSARCSIDPRRIYAAGHSLGGGMAHRLACDLADRIAAIAPVSGSFPPDDACRPARPVPVIAFHGVQDQVIPYGGVGDRGVPPAAYFSFNIPVRQRLSAWAERNGCDLQPPVLLDEPFLAGTAWSGCRDDADVILYSIPDGGHEWPDHTEFNASEMIWEFFERHPMK
jgi:polyhydroxybutyrate depolymerase